MSHKEDAEDLAGDIVLAILQSADRLRDERAFYGYVWGIAANTCKKLYRRQSARVYDTLDDALQVESDEPSIVETLCHEADLNRLRRELAIELGVATVYLEDEVALLTQYGLLTSLPQGKYQIRC